MTDSRHIPESSPSALRVPAGEDRFGERRGLGVSVIDFKVCPLHENGPLIIENRFHAKGGPPRHVHRDFYADVEATPTGGGNAA